VDIDENATGNISQQAVTRSTDNETGHDSHRQEVPLKAPDLNPGSGEIEQGKDQGSPDVSDSQNESSGSATAPNNPKQDPIAKENPYSPDFKSEPEHKPAQDADIDTQGG
jgi:hypothetical protein